MKILAALVLLSMAGNVCATEGFAFSGNSLKDYCDLDDTYASGFCSGYITGVIHGVTSEAIANKKAHSTAGCIPNTVTIEQGTLIVIKFLNDNPELLHLAATRLITSAMSEAFPCDKEQ